MRGAWEDMAEEEYDHLSRKGGPGEDRAEEEWPVAVP